MLIFAGAILALAADLFIAIQFQQGTTDVPLHFVRIKEDLLFKAPLTAFVVANFLSTYQSLAPTPVPDTPAEPFVYVDAHGVKLVTSVVDSTNAEDDGVFALSVAGDGWVEMLAMVEQQG